MHSPVHVVGRGGDPLLDAMVDEAGTTTSTTSSNGSLHCPRVDVVSSMDMAYCCVRGRRRDMDKLINGQ